MLIRRLQQLRLANRKWHKRRLQILMIIHFWKRRLFHIWLIRLNLISPKPISVISMIKMQWLHLSQCHSRACISKNQHNWRRRIFKCKDSKEGRYFGTSFLIWISWIIRRSVRKRIRKGKSGTSASTLRDSETSLILKKPIPTARRTSNSKSVPHRGRCRYLKSSWSKPYPASKVLYQRSFHCKLWIH